MATNMNCDYCGSSMNITTIPVKRIVPKGAKDLGLYDDVISWKCLKCESTKTTGLSKCSKCCKEGPIASDDIFGDAVNTPTWKNLSFPLLLETVYHSDYPSGATYECIDCRLCKQCNQSIGSKSYVVRHDSYEGTSWRHHHHVSCVNELKERNVKQLESAGQEIPILSVIAGAVFGTVIGGIVGVVLSLFLGAVMIPMFAILGSFLWGWIFVRNAREIRVRAVKKEQGLR